MLDAAVAGAEVVAGAAAFDAVDVGTLGVEGEGAPVEERGGVTSFGAWVGRTSCGWRVVHAITPPMTSSAIAAIGPSQLRVDVSPMPLAASVVIKSSVCPAP